MNELWSLKNVCLSDAALKYGIESVLASSFAISVFPVLSAPHTMMIRCTSGLLSPCTRLLPNRHREAKNPNPRSRDASASVHHTLGSLLLATHGSSARSLSLFCKTDTRDRKSVV